MAELLIAYTQRQICQMARDEAYPIAPYASRDGLLPTLDTMEQIPRVSYPLSFLPVFQTLRRAFTAPTIRGLRPRGPHPQNPLHMHDSPKQKASAHARTLDRLVRVVLERQEILPGT